MILYTMMPQELIFPNELVDNKQKLVSCEGVPLLVEETGAQNVQVIRILSTDPQHYMNDRFMPGSKISLAELEGLSAF